jgi:outer membrane protein assembly factor BamA
LIILQAETLLSKTPAESRCVISGISISGNKVTKESIIYKELTFKTGDSLFKKEIDERLRKSRENLLNTSLFNFVTIGFIESENSEMHVYISVIERWYIWPSPIFEHAERNLGAFIHDPDWNRINYGGQISWHNFRGRRENLKIKLRFGYKEQMEFLYNKPNFGRNQRHGITVTFNQTRQHEVNVFTSDNKPVYIRNDNSYLSEVFNPYIVYTYRNSLYSRHFLTMGFIGLTYRDSASHQDFTGLPPGKNPEWFTGEYSYEYDFRDSKAYPLNGNYFKVNLRRRESGLTNSEGFSKSAIMVAFSHHRLLINRLSYNDAIRLQISKDIYEPKVYRSGLGYGPYLRGYELFVMDGNSYALLINNLKYCLMKERSYNLDYIPWSQFNPVHFSMYANLFFDMAYIQGRYYATNGNDYINRFLYTVGLGLDLVSYYDQVVRFEVSVNREGQPGFFIHTEVPFSRW